MFELPPTRKCLSCHHPGTMNHLGWWHHIRVTSSTQQIPKVAKTHVFDLLGHLHKGQEKEEYSIGKSYGFSFFKACVRNPELICGPLLGNSDSLYLQVTTTSSWFTHVFSALFRKNTAPPNQPKSNSLVLVLDKDKPRLWIGCFVFLHGKPTKRFKIPMFSKESKSKIHGSSSL